jgi:flagellar hook assembly protein FlgD
MEMEISIYNTSGQKVRALHSGLQQEGAYHVHWDGKNENGQSVGPGMYFCMMTSESGTITRKISKIR